MKRATGVRILLVAVTTAVITSIVAAALVLGSPEQQRQRRLDECRVRDLSTIANSINLYVGAHGALPADLSALGKEPGPRRAPSDPGTGSPYEYEVLGSESYRLCAVFTTASADAETTPYPEREGWSHGMGKQCFERKERIQKN